MSKFTNTLLKASLFIFFASGILGLYLLSIQQEGNALLCAKMGGFASLGYTAITLKVVLTSSRLSVSSKVLWIMALIVLQVLAGIWYHLNCGSTNHQRLQAR